MFAQIKESPAGHSKRGFTLAELLIALGILGVIATFTIPKVLQARQSAAYNAMAKEAMATISEAYNFYRLHNSVTPTANVNVGLTPYFNYVSVNSSTQVIDNYNSSTTKNCDASHPCLNLHNGAALRFNSDCAAAFGGVTSTHAIYYIFDPDGKVTDSTTNGPGKSLMILLYYDGKITTRGTIQEPAISGVGGCTTHTVDPNFDPSWFSWN